MERVLGPGMPGVPPPQLAPEGRVVPAPESGEIPCHLDGTLVRSEEVQHQRHPTPGECRAFVHSEEVLESRGDPRRLIGFVVHRYLAAAREFKAAGSIPFAAACTDPCDGRSQGTPAMFDSLPYRNDAATVFRRLIRSLPTRRGVLGVATGATLFARSVGSAVGVAAFGAIANTVVRNRLGSEPTSLETLPAGVLDPAIHAVFLASFVVALTLVVAAAFMPKKVVEVTG